LKNTRENIYLDAGVKIWHALCIERNKKNCSHYAYKLTQKITSERLRRYAKIN